jgi:ATP-dependent Clp protease ATP-binding subunit ClpA
MFSVGKYIDRRIKRPVDCSKIIWILASNALDPVIAAFHTSHRDLCERKDDLEELNYQLQLPLRSALKAKFGVSIEQWNSGDTVGHTFADCIQFPLSGRISSIVPFLPFSIEEQAVIAHKFLLRVAENVRRPISLSHQMIGNVILHIHRDTAVCKAIINESYDANTGARSIEAAVKLKVEGPLVREYLAANETIVEGQDVEEYVVEVESEGRIRVGLRKEA